MSSMNDEDSSNNNNALSATVIILEWICPLLGVIAANQMFLAPLRSVRQAVARGSLGALNPLPWAVMLGNCTGWVLYSFVIQNYFIFFANAPGLLLSVYFNLSASQLLYQQQFTAVSATAAVVPVVLPVQPPSDGGSTTDDNTTSCAESRGLAAAAPAIVKQPDAIFHSPRHNAVVLGFVGLYLTVISILCFVRMEPEPQQVFVGLLVNANLVFFYGAPLSTIATILRTRSTASLHIPTMLTNTANGTFWACYGIAVMDWFVILPNGMGAVLGLLQMFLFVIFPRKQQQQSTENDVDKQVISSENDVDKKQDKAEQGELNNNNDGTDTTVMRDSNATARIMSHPLQSTSMNPAVTQNQPENPMFLPRLDGKQ